MGMGFVPTWLLQVSPLLHKTTLTTADNLLPVLLFYKFARFTQTHDILNMHFLHFFLLSATDTSYCQY